jgi:hypothetical protein
MHLSEYDIARYADGAVTSEERHQFEVHLEACERCRRSVAEVTQLQDELSRVPEGEVSDDVLEDAVARLEEHRPPRKGEQPIARAWWYPLAAAIVLGIGLGLWQLMAPSTSERFRSPEPSRPGVELQHPPDGAAVGVPLRLEWTSVEGALTYRVTISRPDGAIVWQADTTAQQLRAPASLSCSPDDTYVWTVDALFADGTTLGSPLHVFECAP